MLKPYPNIFPDIFLHDSINIISIQFKHNEQTLYSIQHIEFSLNIPFSYTYTLVLYHFTFSFSFLIQNYNRTTLVKL